MCPGSRAMNLAADGLYVSRYSPVPFNQNWLAFIYTLMYVHAWAL